LAIVDVEKRKEEEKTALQFFQILSKLRLTTIAVNITPFRRLHLYRFFSTLIKKRKIYQRGESKRREREFRKDLNDAIAITTDYCVYFGRLYI